MLDIHHRLDHEVQRELVAAVAGRVAFDVPMSQHTTFGLGGPADAWVEPSGKEDLASVLDFCRSKGIERFVVGQGTNLLVRDAGIRGVVIRLCAEPFRQIKIEGKRVVAGAGTPNTRLIEALKAAGLSGLEFICGIPGCVGGGVAMNAGAHGSCFADWLSEITVLDPAGTMRAIPRAALDFEYRNLRNLEDSIVVQAAFDLQSETQERVSARVAGLLEIRNATQPKGSSPGCVFKNPDGQSAGRLIDSLGLKGLRVGGAWVSHLHGNFILNDRKAKSREVIELIEKIWAAVFERSGIRLETEVKIVGEE